MSSYQPGQHTDQLVIYQGKTKTAKKNPTYFRRVRRGEGVSAKNEEFRSTEKFKGKTKSPDFSK